MSDVPLISVTQEDDMSDDDQSKSGGPKLNISECHTDIEDMDSDIGDSKPKNVLIALMPDSDCNGAVTDVEDYTDSDDNDDGKEEPQFETEISLNEFLDQGCIDEATQVSGNEKRGKLERCSSITKAPSPSNQFNLCVQNPEYDAVTDCEDLEASGDEDENSKVYEHDDKPIVLEGANCIDIHDAVSNKMIKKPCHKVTEAPRSVSSDSEDEIVKLKPSNRLHAKHFKKEELNKSDVENMYFSDDDTKECGKRSPVVPTLITSDKNEPEILTMQYSGDETPTENKKSFYPEINITFTTEKNPEKKKGATPKLLGLPQNTDEAVTDIENLDSSDSEQEGASSKKYKRRPKSLVIPVAIIKSDALTDVEDFEADGYEEEEDEKIIADVPLPSPVREMTLLRETKDGEPIASTSPLPGNVLLGIDDLDADKGLTDIEDFEDDENDPIGNDDHIEDNEMIPEFEGGIVISSDHTTNATSKPKTSTLELASPNCEPKTDTEDIFVNKPEKNECRRRRIKTKHSSSHHSHHHHHKHNKSTLLQINQGNQGATTDVEELNVSDDDVVLNDKNIKHRRATIEVSSIMNNANSGGKTDVEYMSGDDSAEFIRITPESYNANCLNADGLTITSRDNLGTRETKNNQYRVPVIRKLSPTPDHQRCQTDTEDVQLNSDVEDEALSYSRAQTATPLEVTKALEESGSSQVHEINAGVFDRQKEKLFIKGNQDTNESHTDVEFLEDDGLNVVNGGE